MVGYEFNRCRLGEGLFGRLRTRIGVAKVGWLNVQSLVYRGGYGSEWL